MHLQRLYYLKSTFNRSNYHKILYTTISIKFYLTYVTKIIILKKILERYGRNLIWKT